jgi:large subunit ribosomal protein L10
MERIQVSSFRLHVSGNNMPKTKQQKQVILRDLAKKFEQAKSVVFAHFTGLKVVDNEMLRQDLKQEQSEYYVAKKTLLNLALKDKNLADFDPKGADGQLAVIFGYEDEVAPAKILNKFIKDHEGQVKFLGGILEGKVIDAKAVTILANVPTRTELYAKLVGSINAPVSGFVNALAGNLRNLVNVLHAVQEKKTN